MVCCDCHQQFLALGEWQTRCRSCYHALKAGREIPASAVEVERLRAENTALRQELAQARSEVARWRRIAQAAPGNAPHEPAEPDPDPGRPVAPDCAVLPSGPPRWPCIGCRSHPLVVGESAMSPCDKRDVTDLHRQLMDRFPNAFPKDYDAIRPLKLGIHADILHRWPEVDPVLLRRALANHTRRDGYLLALLHDRGDRRYDLDGQPVGTRTPRLSGRKPLGSWKPPPSAAKPKAAQVRSTRPWRRSASQQRASERRSREAKAARKAEYERQRAGDRCPQGGADGPGHRAGDARRGSADRLCASRSSSSPPAARRRALAGVGRAPRADAGSRRARRRTGRCRRSSSRRNAASCGPPMSNEPPGPENPGHVTRFEGRCSICDLQKWMQIITEVDANQYMRKAIRWVALL